MTPTNHDYDCIIVVEANYFPLSALANIQLGYPFRGAIEAQDNGDTLVIQMRDVEPEHGIRWESAIRTSLAGRKAPEWLQAGDVMVLARGSRFFAVCVDAPPQPAVCAPIFFHLRLCTPALDPAFLAWQINQPPCQKQLAVGAEGSAQLSIRRTSLEALQIAVPPLQQQRTVLALAELARAEARTLQRLIELRQQEMQTIAEALRRASPVYAKTEHYD